MKNTLAEWLSYLDNINVFKIDLTLERMQQAVAELGIDSSTVANKKVITVAGTNGKGTTVTMLSDLLIQQGYRVGSYFSPHLFKFNERIQLNLNPISDAELVNCFNEIEPCFERYQLTYFECVTLAALSYFSKQSLDYVVLEVGLGGRLDAVNVLDPDYSIITNIELDHMAWLGDTREAIGFEKAGIIRSKKPVIYASDNLPESIKTVALTNQSDLYQYGTSFGIHQHEDGQTHIYVSSGQTTQLPQTTCSAQQISSVCQLYYLMFNQVPDKSSLALSTKKLLGRMRIVHKPSRTYLFDVAHNEASIIRLVEQLIELKVQGKIHLVYACMADKDCESMVSHLKPYIDQWHIAPLSIPRALAVEALAHRLTQSAIDDIHTYENATAAFLAAEQATQSGDLIVVAGSFYLLAELEEVYQRCVS